MISRVSSAITREVQNLFMARATYVGLLEYPPVDMGSYTECKSQGYARVPAAWSVVRDGFLVIPEPMRFVGLDVPVSIMAIGLFPGPGATMGLTAWGALDLPLNSVNGVIIVGGGTVSVRIG